MPEGDTIYRAARTLQRALGGHVVTHFETQLAQLDRVDCDRPLVGRSVEGVEANGKWMLIRFSGDMILLTHMLMSGSWHIYRPGETWQRPRSQMRVVIATDAFVAVAFQVPIAEFHTNESLERRRGLRTLGPSLLAGEFDEKEALGRIRQYPDLEVGVALLTQSLLAGIGNVYKSESCFVSGINPFRKVATLNEDELSRLLMNARRLMLANVAAGSTDQITTYSGLRRTTSRSDPEARLWVYHRRGEPCRRCGEAIEARKQGEDARTSFWCPQCQPLARAAKRG